MGSYQNMSSGYNPFEKKDLNINQSASSLSSSSGYSSPPGMPSVPDDWEDDLDEGFSPPGAPGGVVMDGESAEEVDLEALQGLPFPELPNIKIPVSDYHYETEDEIEFTDDNGNTYEVEYIDEEWKLTNITNSEGEFMSLMFDEIDELLIIFKENGITLEGMDISEENDYVYFYTNHGDFLFDGDIKGCRFIANADDEFFNDNNIYSLLHMITHQYGSYQGILNLYSEKYLQDEKIKEILHNYFPDQDISEEQLQLLFSRVKRIGCGYVACMNTLFDEFGYLTDEEWKAAFGFDRVDENGNYNYPYLFLDFFLYYQQQEKQFNSIDELLGNEKELVASDEVDEIEDIALLMEEGVPELSGADGMDTDFLIDRMTGYLQSMGIDANITAVDCENTNYQKEVEKALKNGQQIILAAGDVDVLFPYDIDTNGLIDDPYLGDVGDHGFTVTGITDDGYWLVSTWGRQLLVDPNDFDADSLLEIYVVDYEGGK